MSSPNTYTLTYSTVDRTLVAPTATVVGDTVATNNGWGSSTEAGFDSMHTAIDALVADNLDLRKIIAALITDFKAQREVRFIN